jgi:hypothetical protein
MSPHTFSPSKPQALSRNTGQAGRDGIRVLFEVGGVWAATLRQGSLSSPETWPSGPLIQIDRGRTRNSLEEFE